MKRWGAFVVFAVGVVLADGAAKAETPDEAKARIAKEHEECVALHRNDPRAVAECDAAKDEKEKSHHQNSVADTKALFGVKLDKDALAAAVALEKQLGKPLDHTLALAAARHMPSLHDEVSAKVKEAAAALEQKAKPLVEPHAKELADDLAKWAKAENEKNQKALASFKERLDKDAEKQHWSRAEVEKKMKHEKEMLARRFESDLLRKLDADFRKYDQALDAEIKAKAEEIWTAERSAWQPKLESSMTAQTKVTIPDLGSAKDKLFERAAATKHYTKGIVYALLRAWTFHKLEADIRKQANV